jgi:hypothetical protein
VLLESFGQVKFHRVYFTVFKSYGVEDIDILVDFVVGNLNRFQKLGLEGKIS